MLEGDKSHLHPVKIARSTIELPIVDRDRSHRCFVLSYPSSYSDAHTVPHRVTVTFVEDHQ